MYKQVKYFGCINFFTMQNNSSYQMFVQPFGRRRGSKMDRNVPGARDLMQDANFLTMKKISKKKKKKTKNNRHRRRRHGNIPLPHRGVKHVNKRRKKKSGNKKNFKMWKRL